MQMSKKGQSMTDSYLLYTSRGCGSAIVEAALETVGAPYEREEAPFGPDGPESAALSEVNPLRQIPTLRLPGGEILSESAAIVLYLAERFPDAGLAPEPQTPSRTRFLRWLMYLNAAVYPTFTYADFPARWVDGEAEGAAFVARIGARRQALWEIVEREGAPGQWFLGDRFSALDLYICAMTQWQPGRDWFAKACPKLYDIALRVDAIDGLRDVWGRNF